MKKLTILLLILSVNTFTSCNDETEKRLTENPINLEQEKEPAKVNEKKDIPKKENPKTKTVTSSNSEIVNSFLQDINTLKDVKNPITSFIADAENSASLKMNLNAESVKEVLTTAKQYKHLVIVVGKHTIVKVTDLEKCITSGSWKACMPYGKGFIKRSSNLNYKQDYCNNIIGIPDTQERTAYFFN